MNELFSRNLGRIDRVKVILHEEAARINTLRFPTLINAETIAIHPDDEEEFIGLFVERKMENE